MKGYHRSLLLTLASNLQDSEIIWTAANESERQAKIFELQSVIQYVHRRFYKDRVFHSRNLEALSILLQVCNSFKAKDEALFLFNLELINSPKKRWTNPLVLDHIAEFIGFAGWEDCEQFIDGIVRSISTDYDTHSALIRFILPLITKLLV